jgi:hypothetical protein
VRTHMERVTPPSYTLQAAAQGITVFQRRFQVG